MDVNAVSAAESAPLATEAPPLPRGDAAAPCTEVCPQFHEAIELIGKRWTGAIVCALTERPMRFGELGKVVPGLSDRLLLQRLGELEDVRLVHPELDSEPAVGVPCW